MDERYTRQIALKLFGIESQKKLSAARVLVVGAGGLGVPALQYLNAMGIGKIGAIDNDIVSLNNLHRQVLYSENDLGLSKVATAIKKLKAQNSTTELIGYEHFLTKENAIEIINEYDIVLDASDNFPTRYLVNDTCVILKKPFVYGALHGFEGQVSVFNFLEGPTYRCLFPIMPQEDEIPNCNEQGVLGVVPGIIGNLQALEVVKIITGIGKCLAGELLIFDGLEQNYHKFRIKTNAKNKLIDKLQNSYELSCSFKIAKVTAQEFNNILFQNKETQLVDVRTKEEYETYHLSQAINAPFDTIEASHLNIDFGREIYLLCQSGARSSKAIQKLRIKYPTANLINIEGGLNELKKYASAH